MPKWIEMAHEKCAHIWPTYWYWLGAQKACKMVGKPAGLFGSWYKNNEMSYVTTEGALSIPGKTILEKIRKDKNFIKKIVAVNKKEIPKMLAVSKWFEKTDLQKQSGKNIYKYFQQFEKRFSKLMGWSVLGTVMEFEKPVFSQFLEEILRKKLGSRLEKLGECFVILTSSPRRTIAQTEEEALYKLKLQQVDGADITEKLKQHTKKYSFVFFGYDGPGMTLGAMRERLEQLPENKKSIKGKILELQSRPKELLKKQKEIVKRLKLSQEEFRLFCAMQILGFWKFERKAQSQKSHEMMERLFLEIARRFNLSLAQAKSITPYEMQDVLCRNRINPNLLNQRIKLCISLFKGPKYNKVVVGKKAAKIEQEILDSLRANPNLKELHGACAYPGKASGRVCRVDDENEMKKFKDGDVLVSASTSPKLVTIMKKASAIVTDSGGITSHAAIVSRELKVPCVIGTKVATQIFKDGDRVEVDAGVGIVKKIN